MGKEWRAFVETPAGAPTEACSLRGVFGLDYLPSTRGEWSETRTDVYLGADENLGVKLRGKGHLEVKIRNALREESLVESWAKKSIPMKINSAGLVDHDRVLERLKKLSDKCTLSPSNRVPILEYLQRMDVLASPSPNPLDAACNKEGADSASGSGTFLTEESGGSALPGQHPHRTLWFQADKKRTSAFTHGYSVVLELCEVCLTVKDHQAREIPGVDPIIMHSFAAEANKFHHLERFLEDTQPLTRLRELHDSVSRGLPQATFFTVGGYPTMISRMMERVAASQQQ